MIARIMVQPLPRFVWVTELAIFEELNDLDDDKRTIRGHAVVDATACEFWDALLVFHGPGFLWQWFHDPSGGNRYVNTLVPIRDDVRYSPRRRD